MDGKATVEGTRRHAEAHEGVAYRPLGDTGLLVSQAGFGGYRVDVSIEQHRQALRYALEHGINVIDTSANYADGGSEMLVGEVLAELTSSGDLRREAVVIVTKAGYLQGQNYELSQERKQAGTPFPDLVEYAEGLEHCLHPEFLADQLGRSRERLKLATIDGYLLHNPEYFLSWAHKASVNLAQARQEYYRRIELAFHYLEEAAAEGHIQWYGISSNTFPHPADDPEFTSLERVWQIAESLPTGPAHRFRLIQLPMNLFEVGAATEKNQSGGRNVLDFAQEKALGTLINRPLNAIHNHSLIRLADVPPPSYPATPEEVSTAVDTSVQVEETFQREILPQLGLAAEAQRQLLQYLAVGLTLEGRWHGFGTYQNWRDVQTQFLQPRAQNAVEFLSNRPDLPAEARLWLDHYVDAVNITLTAVSAFYQAQGAAEADRIQTSAVQADPEWRAATLSQTAVRALRSTAGISSVLVGMRRQAYVEDVLAGLATPVTQKGREQAWRAVGQLIRSQAFS